MKNELNDFIEFIKDKRWDVYFISSPKQYWWAVHSLWWYTDTRFKNVLFAEFTHYIWYDYEKILSFQKIKNWYRVITETYNINYTIS